MHNFLHKLTFLVNKTILKKKGGYTMDYIEIFIRIFLATIMAGVIGYEREQKNRPAGIKTHILVCIGGATFAILERLLIQEGIAILKSNPALVDNYSVVNTGRLVAQVISGIGFLGAGTIIVTRRNVTGLTTAASIWIVACLGIVVGYGMYPLAIITFLTIMITLVVLKKVIRVSAIKRLEIKYHRRVETKEFIQQYFNDKGIVVKDVDFNVESTEAGNIYTNIYTLDLISSTAYNDVVEDLSIYKNIIRIRTIGL